MALTPPQGRRQSPVPWHQERRSSSSRAQKEATLKAERLSNLHDDEAYACLPEVPAQSHVQMLSGPVAAPGLQTCLHSKQLVLGAVVGGHFNTRHEGRDGHTLRGLSTLDAQRWGQHLRTSGIHRANSARSLLKLIL